MDHYSRDFGDLVLPTPSPQNLEPTSNGLPATPPSIYSWVSRVIRGESVDNYPDLESTYTPLTWSRKITSFYKIISTKGQIHRYDVVPVLSCVNAGTLTYLSCYSAEVAEAVALAMSSEEFTLHDLECLPIGLALPLREALRVCRYNPPNNWPTSAYELISRDDLAYQQGNCTTSSALTRPMCASRACDFLTYRGHSVSTPRYLALRRVIQAVALYIFCVGVILFLVELKQGIRAQMRDLGAIWAGYSYNVHEGHISGALVCCLCSKRTYTKL